jgi:hypothetical protein
LGARPGCNDTSPARPCASNAEVQRETNASLQASLDRISTRRWHGGRVALALAHDGIEFSALYARQHGSLHASPSGGNASDFNDSVD